MDSAYSGGAPQNLRLQLLDLFHEIRGANIHPQVHHAVPGAAEDGHHDVLADLVRVTFHGTDEDGCLGRGSRTLQERCHAVHHLAIGLRRQYHVGKEVVALLP